MQIPKVGALVVLSNHPEAQIYTVLSTFSRNNGAQVVAELVYLSEYGKACFGGYVDVSSLLQPTEDQLT